MLTAMGSLDVGYTSGDVHLAGLDASPWISCGWYRRLFVQFGIVS